MIKVNADIHQAAELLNKEELVAIPTETVYGLAGNIYSEKAIKGIFEMKKRPFFNPLIVHIKSLEYLKEVAIDVPENAYKLANAFWPGPLTLVLKKKENISDLVTAGKDTVAVRIPDHPIALALLEILDFPLAAPSANPFGCISPTQAQHVANYFPDELKMVLDGGICERGIESTIVGFQEGKTILYRYGSVAVEDIEAVVGEVFFITKNDTTPDAPGMLTKHYAPKTATYLTENVAELISSFIGKRIGVLLLDGKLAIDSQITTIVLSEKGDLIEAAKNLYESLHQLDKMNLDVIIAQKMPEVGLGVSINDRLERATKK
ncbi:L-threonylcarbamoyladenylate synthase [Flavobacterium cellulosilyticum]|uniref:Threonylcarbamoyl-AMP synthase n=1 Tax=Flavobacterium cellulosilyticum TaxID=2541731 RepID=A0A4R5CEP9_9FLAO|nr:L-threonylcarbamoyladenylate synthase [Flavobacterium cellulosilyticum]TDD97396.1 threonylcarbamoyl-AMP synthase [Flavobacterium cellulosilyticum]